MPSTRSAVGLRRAPPLQVGLLGYAVGLRRAPPLQVGLLGYAVGLRRAPPLQVGLLGYAGDTSTAGVHGASPQRTLRSRCVVRRRGRAAQGVTAVALEAGAGARPRLAAAARAGKRAASVAVLEPLPGAAALGPAARCAATLDLAEPLSIKARRYPGNSPWNSLARQRPCWGRWRLGSPGSPLEAADGGCHVDAVGARAALRPRPPGAAERARAAQLQAMCSRRGRPGPAPLHLHTRRVRAAQPHTAAGCSVCYRAPSAAPSPPLQPAAGARLRCAQRGRAAAPGALALP